MKNESNTLGNISHTSIQTKHVFAENNQVYLRKSDTQNTNTDEWFPINFQWISDVELKKNMKHQSNL